MTIPIEAPFATDLERADFGGAFRWGTSTSSYQIEGGIEAGGRAESIWDRFCRQPGAIRDASSGAVACDHYHLWERDLDIARAMGTNAYRFSVAWPRIVTARGAAPSQAGLDFYSRLVDGMLERGLEPWLTLYHWDLPQYLEDEGGWRNRATVDAFVEYADAVTRRLGDRVKHWITHNEPWCTSIHGHYDGVHAPGLKDFATALQVAHHVLLSHGRATPVIRANVKDARVGIALSLHPLRAASDAPEDVQAMRRHDGLRNRWFLDPLYGRGYPADIRACLEAAMPLALGGDMQAIAAPLDFLGVNYYFPERVAHAPGASPLDTRVVQPDGLPRTAFGWEVAPEGLSELLLRVHAEYRPGDLYVTENGSTWDDAVDGNGQIDDVQRLDYLLKHLQATRAAIAAGCPVKGYFAWSLLDNFEWSEGYTRRFGLNYVDFATQQRTLKRSGRWLSGFLGGALPDR